MLFNNLFMTLTPMTILTTRILHSTTIHDYRIVSDFIHATLFVLRRTYIPT